MEMEKGEGGLGVGLTFEEYHARFDPAYETELHAVGGLFEDFKVIVVGDFGGFDGSG